MIKFLHAADFHLDSPFSGLSPEQAASRRAEQRAMLTALVNCCNENDCQILLLSGDLFDSTQVYQDTIDALLQAFSACRAEIFIAPGNHDFYAAGSPYAAVNWPENVHIFQSSQISSILLPNLNCRVYGAAFTSPSSTGLLTDFIAPAEDTVKFMVLHGDVQSPDGPYNPITTEEIAKSGLDYLALGHVHTRSDLRCAGKTHYAWPGCPLGRGFDETGEKGVLIGTVSANECSLTFHSLSGRRYQILRCNAGADPLASIRSALPAETKNDIYRIILTGESEPINLRELTNLLAPQFYSVSIQDQTAFPVSLWASAGENTLRGLYLQLLKAQLQSTPQECKKIEQAARLGLAALDGREVSPL